MIPDDDNDHELVAAAQAGDRRALEELLAKHQPRIYALCRRITGDDTDALDATQDSLIAVVRGLPGFDGNARFSTWVYRVSTNACLDELRRRRRRPLPGLPDDGAGGMSGSTLRGALWSADPGGSTADDVALRLDVDTALATLPPDYRAAVVLRDLCTLDYGEIAEVLGIPAGTVRSRIARGRAALAEQLGGNQTAAAERQTPAQEEPLP